MEIALEQPDKPADALKEAKRSLVLLLKARADRRAKDKLSRYKPYLKQLEFHRLGATKRERLLRAGNQQGKTYSGGAEAAFHATGRYPNDWEGKRFDHPVVLWAGSDTGETTRDNPQRILCGELGSWGTGMIPGRLLGSKTAPRGKYARGTPDLLDYVHVKHVSGGYSLVRFKPYSLGRQKFQGPSVHVVWFDEEPPEDVYYEGLARLTATKGICYTTFTPLLGMSKVVMRFLKERSPDRADINMTIEDAEHLSVEDRQRIIDGYPEHQRDARIKGIPILGSGQVYPIDLEAIKFDAQEFNEQPFWVELGAIDFGWTHPTAAVRGVWDRDNDIVYITHAYRKSERDPIYHAAALRIWGEKLTWAWPHDGENSTAAGAGKSLADQYRAQGLNFLPERSSYEDGSISVEAGVMDLLSRMVTGRLKVASHLGEWFEEAGLYHRKDGRIVKVLDDLMDATRILIMSLRHGRPIRPMHKQRRHRGSGWAM